jgi:hypothetical protein
VEAPRRRLDLGRGVTFEVYSPEAGCCTVFPDGARAHATRDDTEENRREAADQGHASVWESLVHHEVLHTLIGRRLWGRESLVLRHESGAEQHRYALRLHEEAAVISAQRLLNTIDPVLRPLVFR